MSGKIFKMTTKLLIDQLFEMKDWTIDQNSSEVDIGISEDLNVV